MKVKNVLMAMVFSVAVLGGYQAYEHASMTSVDSFLLENVEALASGSDTDGGKVIKCYCTSWHQPTHACAVDGGDTSTDPCAQSTPGGNIKCNEYTLSNCVQ